LRSFRAARADAGLGVGGRDGFGASYQAEADEISKMFALRLAALRRRLRPWEIPAAALALRMQRKAAIVALRERRKLTRHSLRLARRRMHEEQRPR
jgi:hypothetical protein